ncbi:MAG: hypothetical protein COX70_03500 [Flavobacteriales bacterium CG_4_10_14_0_2_um_filter_32_8]|nr:MAG: hypothetical protein COX70_03500 [Flavobacteriales bacterium CG_4_10_14_0_2_um_filter_32_8]PJB15568.1 MAG: hypothetical protein CO118_02955 [Flavobacteriales bacterium CG_4_9_14_3_um_filter_32_8]
MKNNKLYKYINFLIRITIGVFAVWLIYDKTKDNFNGTFQQTILKEINFYLIGIVIIMMVLNWGLEAFKWRYSIRKVQEISFFKAFRITITGITLGLITPNRIGEIPSRALLLNRQLFKELTLKTIVSSFSQVLITLLLGVIGLMFSYHLLYLGVHPIILIVVLIMSTLLLFLIYFRVNKLDFFLNKIRYFRKQEIVFALSEFSSLELSIILLMSTIRYIVFTVQFYLILTAFSITLSSINDVMLIPVCFMFASFIPTLLISEIGVRGAVAVFVFGTISNLEIQIIMASILLWLINIALPALIGIFNLKEIKLFKEN